MDAGRDENAIAWSREAPDWFCAFVSDGRTMESRARQKGKVRYLDTYTRYNYTTSGKIAL